MSQGAKSLPRQCWGMPVLGKEQDGPRRQVLPNTPILGGSSDGPRSWVLPTGDLDWASGSQLSPSPDLAWDADKQMTAFCIKKKNTKTEFVAE